MVIPIMINATIATVNKIVRKMVILESLKDTFFIEALFIFEVIRKRIQTFKCTM